MNTIIAFLELTFSKDKCGLERLAACPLSIKHISQVNAFPLEIKQTIKVDLRTLGSQSLGLLYRNLRSADLLRKVHESFHKETEPEICNTDL